MDLDPRTEDQLELLCDAHNRAVCDVLGEAGASLHVAELADRLVARSVDVVPSDVYDEGLDRTRLELHHDRLPRLSEVDLVEYDPASNLVAPPSSPTSDVGWRGEATIERLVTYLETLRGDEESDLGVIEGFESAFRYARKLADEAEEELFAIYVDTDLLEDECLSHGEDALERGVRIHLGSRNGTVRDLCRENLPEATVWEPQFDWLNTSSYPRVGRLLLADRRKVMFSVLEEPTSEGDPSEEVAFVGTGEDNPLVVLVRELLGPRLDHLDHQSADFRRELHP